MLDEAVQDAQPHQWLERQALGHAADRGHLLRYQHRQAGSFGLSAPLLRRARPPAVPLVRSNHEVPAEAVFAQDQVVGGRTQGDGLRRRVVLPVRVEVAVMPEVPRADLQDRGQTRPGDAGRRRQLAVVNLVRDARIDPGLRDQAAGVGDGNREGHQSAISACRASAGASPAASSKFSRSR